VQKASLRGPTDTRATALDVNIFCLLCAGMMGVAQVVVIFSGTHVFPRLPLVDAQLVAIVKAVVCQLGPHVIPLCVIRVDVFHGIELSLTVRVH